MVLLRQQAGSAFCEGGSLGGVSFRRLSIFPDKIIVLPNLVLFLHSETGKRMSRLRYRLALDVPCFSVNRLHRAGKEWVEF